MARLKFSIHPLFLIFGIIAIYFGLGAIFLSYLITIILHEFGHAIVAKKLGYELKNISLLPFGAELNIKDGKFIKNDEIIIAIAGPLVNVILIFIFVALWWIFPTTYFWTEYFVYANLVTFIFNVLPIFPLDGGRVLLALLTKKMKRINAEKIVNNLSIILSFLFFILFLISLFFQVNYNLGIISIFLLTGAFNFNSNAIYERYFHKKNFSKLKTRGIDINLYAVSEDMPLYKLLTLVNNNNYNMFVVVSPGGKNRIITEQNLEKYLLKYDSLKTLKEIL